MSTSSRVRHHLRSNVVAYVALFAALGGTAVALPGRNRVDSNDIAKKAVKSRALANEAVKPRALRQGAVTNAKLGAGAVSASKLLDGAVVQTKLGESAVVSGKIAEDAVTRGKIVQGAVNGGKLANGAVNSPKVDDGSLQAADFAPGQISDGFLFAAENGTFTIARPGRVLLTVTLAPMCPTPPCVFAVEVDGTLVPGASFTLSGPAPQVTVVGLTPALVAGEHDISLSISAGASAAQPRLSGVLLQ